VFIVPLGDGLETRTAMQAAGTFSPPFAANIKAPESSCQAAEILKKIGLDGDFATFSTCFRDAYHFFHYRRGAGMSGRV
jgi:hypothetical protein